MDVDWSHRPGKERRLTLLVNLLLDELAVALRYGAIRRAAAQELIDLCLRYGETVVTGRNAPDWLMEEADYCTVMQEIRHPYRTESLAAREGVEW